MHPLKTQITQNTFLSNKSTESSSTLQHGLLLLHIPPESLTHITSYLDPRSLLALAQVNCRLSDHIRDDHTWHRALVYQLLGISPQSDLHNAKSLLLRRSHLGSWRQEFILYFSLRRRWERSRNTTTAHIPLHSPVSSMYLMPAHGLISSSLQYGVVSRSLPFTGRILRGYLDAAGSGTGLGIGNPNTEFTPNVSVCALGADGGTAKIVWGFRNGEVAFTTANKAMDAGSRSAAKFSKCAVGVEHQGVVLDVIWDGANAVTGGGDGRVKIWDAKKSQCLWTSEGRAPDECVKVASALSKGVVAGAMRSGDIVVWRGFASEMPSGPTSVDVLTIPCPIRADGASREISALHIDSCGPSPALLVTFTDSALFYRFGIDFSTGTVECAQFGEPALGAITTLVPFFTSQPGEFSLVMTGTQLGCVGIYDWAAVDIPLPAHKFEAYEDGVAITALAWNGIRSTCGRSPRRPTQAHPAAGAWRAGENPAVRQIVLGPEKVVLLVAVGDRVMAWRAGPVPKGGFKRRSSGPGKKKEQRAVASKYHQQIEMHQAIVESRHLLEEESQYVQRAYGREREHRARLETLGLDEVEAVEYRPIDQGVFEGDFDDDGTAPAAAPQSRSPSPASSCHSPSTPPRSTACVPTGAGRPIPRASPSPSNNKIQVSPPFRAEPSEALFAPSPPTARSVPAAAGAHFPPSGGTTRAGPPPGSSSASASASWGGRVSRASSSGFSLPTDDMDDDLRLAIELSLVEARTREGAT
ncbi:hypothetical protein B0H17DRAFT_1059760 [Mycena rosella]|uniref:F-box domain-containing protein n=1 Tax=Mycena rosella TaxID=1033263 RepID=A0AAD7GKI3_MYCRO|nr:hypothetical protein B0H17DRAFT_1059760 [Mycena rosella]